MHLSSNPKKEKKRLITVSPAVLCAFLWISQRECKPFCKSALQINPAKVECCLCVCACVCACACVQ